MKNGRLQKTLFFAVLAGVLGFAQVSQGNLAFVQPFVVPQQAYYQPALIPTVLNVSLLPQVKVIESKNLWVGNEELLFHISARESFRTVNHYTFYSRRVEAYFKKYKVPFLRLALLILASENKSTPLRLQDLKAVSLLNKSA